MENIIFCFSGTGNSLYVAKELATKIENTEVILISDLIDKDVIKLNYQTVGIICPTYYGNLPPIVEEFIGKLEFENVAYVYSVVTAGSFAAKTFSRLSELIDRKGVVLDSYFKVVMPGNFIAMYSAFPKIIQNHYFKKSERTISKISNAVLKKKVKRSPIKVETKSLKETIDDYNSFSKDYVVSDECIKCGLCVKVCPSDNIVIADDIVSFNNKCERCMACIQWCCAKAINYKEKTQKRVRYTNPKINIEELFKIKDKKIEE